MRALRRPRRRSASARGSVVRSRSPRTRWVALVRAVFHAGRNCCIDHIRRGRHRGGMRDQFVGESGVVLEKALAYWIHRVYQASRNEMFRMFREHGEEITPEQWIVLVRLWEED